MSITDGDIIFQNTGSQQDHAIRIATGSDYSHVGIVVHYKGELMIMEAVQPVKLTSIKDFIKRSLNDPYEVKRLKSDSLLNDLNGKFYLAGKPHLGKKYDYRFMWGEEELYCSELVYKLYQQVLNITLCELKSLKSYKLENPEVKKQMELRYGANIPENELMVSPGDIYHSDYLRSVRNCQL